MNCFVSSALHKGSNPVFCDWRESNPAFILPEYPPRVRIFSSNRLPYHLLLPRLLGLGHTNIMRNSGSYASYR